MIVITHTPGEIRIEGHAGYDVIGRDIVCAAVSVLTETFIEGVRKLTPDELKCEIAAGKVVIQYGNLSTEAQLLMSSFFVGVGMVANSYPANVKLIAPAVDGVKSYGMTE